MGTDPSTLDSQTGTTDVRQLLAESQKVDERLQRKIFALAGLIFAVSGIFYLKSRFTPAPINPTNNTRAVKILVDAGSAWTSTNASPWQVCQICWVSSERTHLKTGPDSKTILRWQDTESLDVLPNSLVEIDATGPSPQVIIHEGSLLESVDSSIRIIHAVRSPVRQISTAVSPTPTTTPSAATTLNPSPADWREVSQSQVSPKLEAKWRDGKPVRLIQVRWPLKSVDPQNPSHGANLKIAQLLPVIAWQPGAPGSRYVVSITQVGNVDLQLYHNVQDWSHISTELWQEKVSGPPVGKFRYRVVELRRSKSRRVLQNGVVEVKLPSPIIQQVIQDQRIVSSAKDFFQRGLEIQFRWSPLRFADHYLILLGQQDSLGRRKIVKRYLTRSNQLSLHFKDLSNHFIQVAAYDEKNRWLQSDLSAPSFFRPVARGLASIPSPQGQMPARAQLQHTGKPGR